MNNTFKNCESIEEGKKLYRDLSKEFHPDKPNGSTEKMQELNNSFDHFLMYFHEGRMRNFYQEKEWSFKESFFTPFQDILSKIIHFEEMEIELIGFWIYCFNSIKYKDQLKDMGFWFSGRHKAWVYNGGKKKKGRSHYTTNDVRSMHGSADIDTEKRDKLAS